MVWGRGQVCVSVLCVYTSILVSERAMQCVCVCVCTCVCGWVSLTLWAGGGMRANASIVLENVSVEMCECYGSVCVLWCESVCLGVGVSV